jgi:WD40 repeat protein
MDFTKLFVCDVRVLGAIGAALIALTKLSIPGSLDQRAGPRFAAGERGVQASSFAYSPTGKQIATTNTAGRVMLRVQQKGWWIERWLDYPGYARSVAFSPDGRSLAAGGIGAHVCLWDLTSSASEPFRPILIPMGRARCVMYSPDGQSLVVTTDLDGTIVVWDLAIRRERLILRNPSPILSAAISPDGQWLATGGRDDRSIVVWNLQNGFRQTLSAAVPGPARALAFSPDGTTLASASSGEHDVRLWDLDSGHERRVFDGG